MQNTVTGWLGLWFILAVLFAVGCSASVSTSTPEFNAVSAHEVSALNAVLHNDRGAAARLPTSTASSVVAMLDLYATRNQTLIDWGLSIVVREVRHNSDGSTTVFYMTGISRRERWAGDSIDSYSEHYLRAVIRNGEVAEVETLLDGSSEFRRIHLLPPLEPRRTIRQMPDDRYAPSSNEESAQNAASMAAFEIASPASLRSYALNWCGTGRYNPVYPNYEWNFDLGVGGDCTNFVSQCLQAGNLGFRDLNCSGLSGSLLTTCRSRRTNWATYWWYDSAGRTHSNSWSTPSGLRNHMTERFGSTSGTVHWVWEQAHVGDVVFVDNDRNGTWDHAMVVTTAQWRTLTQFDLRVSGHTSPRCDSDFYTDSIAKGGAWIQIQHIP